MIPLRTHLSLATSALVLVVPVVAGVVTGGFVAGLVSVVAGFLVYDFVFILPYYTFTVAAGQNWVALGVYAVVMVIIARVVASLDEARATSSARAKNARHLFELSEFLLAERHLDDLGQSIVQAVEQTFALDGVTLMLSLEGHLEVVASSGLPIEGNDIAKLQTPAGKPVRLATATSTGTTVHTLALAASGRPVGLLVMRGSLNDPALRELLPILANHLALALERAQLHELAVRAEILEEIDRLRRALVGAVSHDLRSPLATIKVASTTLQDSGHSLLETDSRQLYRLIDLQTDRLTRLVTSLLDMTRLEAGVLKIERTPSSALDLIGEAVAGMRPALDGRRVDVSLPDDLPVVEADSLLIGQVLTNLLDNANRHAPLGTSITIAAEPCDRAAVALSVTDRGPGVPAKEHESVFESFVRFDTGGRAGLGLALSKTFVEAHGGRIWVEDASGGGARFVFTLPVVAADPIEP
jgi:two-component system sensor histidine kinase KdpD